MKVLFIGGHANGQWHDVEHLQQELHLADPVTAAATCFSSASIEPVPYRRTIYHLERLRDRGGDYYVYVTGKAAEGFVIEALLNGYKP